MNRLLTQCPSCGHGMIVTEMSCTHCETVVRGKYTGCSFCRLSDEDLRFMEIFVSCRGNVKEMERETGLGYWTIRGRLDEVIESLKLTLQAAAPPDDIAARRRAILEAVEREEIGIEEAEQMLLALGKS